MKKDSKGCLIATIAVIAIPLILVWGFHIDLSLPFILIGVLSLVLLPAYVSYRINKNRDEDEFKRKVEELLEESIESLSDLEEMVGECIKRLDEIKDYEKWKDEMRRIPRNIENFDEEETAIEELESFQEEIKSITDNLKGFHSILNPLPYF